MPEADSGGYKPIRRGPSSIQVVDPLPTPVAPAGTGTRAPSAPSAPAGTGKAGGTKSSTSSSSSSGGYDYAAEARKTKNAARLRYIRDAEALEGQIAALRKALGGSGTFKKALKGRLGNVNRVLDQQVKLMKDGYEERKASLDADALNNEISAGDSTADNSANRIRERSMALGETLNMGGGESDMLRTQLMSLRNWNANQGEINRAFFDGERSINAARVDLDVDTRTALANMYNDANDRKESLFNEFYAQTSESQTSLGNALGQQGEYYSLAIEQGGGSVGGGKGKGKGKGKDKIGKVPAKALGMGKGGAPDYARGENPFTPEGSSGGTRPHARQGFRPGEYAEGTVPTGVEGGRPVPQYLTTDTMMQDGSWLSDSNGPGKGQGSGKGKGKGKGKGGSGSVRVRMRNANAASDKAFMDAAKTMGRYWKNPGLPDEVTDWEIDQRGPSKVANSSIYAGPTATLGKRPEGATLRTW